MKTLRQIAIPLLLAANFATILFAYDSIKSKTELNIRLREKIQEIKDEDDYQIEAKEAKIRVLERKIEQMQVRPRVNITMK